MRALRASTSYSVGFGISPLSAPPTRPSSSTHRRHVAFACAEPSEKSVEIMRKFSEQYARKSGTYFCMDKGVTAVVIKGLAEHRDTLGAPLCPCRHYDDKTAEAQQGFWNCPCVPMRERYIVQLEETNLSLSSVLPHCALFNAMYVLKTHYKLAFDRKECHCMLFLTPDNDFAGQEQTISLEEIRETTANM